MFGIGTPELLVILVVALVVLGPKRLPEVARTLGKGLAELRKATSGLTQELNQARNMLEEEVRAAERATKITPPPAAAVERQTAAASDAAAAEGPADGDEEAEAAPSKQA